MKKMNAPITSLGTYLVSTASAGFAMGPMKYAETETQGAMELVEFINVHVCKNVCACVLLLLVLTNCIALCVCVHLRVFNSSLYVCKTVCMCLC